MGSLDCSFYSSCVVGFVQGVLTGFHWWGCFIEVRRGAWSRKDIHRSLMKLFQVRLKSKGCGRLYMDTGFVYLTRGGWES